MGNLECPQCGNALANEVAVQRPPLSQEKGLTKEAWIGELNNRAKVEILAK